MACQVFFAAAIYVFESLKVLPMSPVCFVNYVPGLHPAPEAPANLENQTEHILKNDLNVLRVRL
jgi:hypothetical protein